MSERHHYTRAADDNFIPPIFGSPACEEKPFQFVPAELLHPEDRDSLLEFVKGRQVPVVMNAKHPVYTWDFFEWMRGLDKKEPERSINKAGIGYCGGCGEFVRFRKDDAGRWECGKCGYAFPRIFDCRYKRRDEKNPGV